MTFENFKGFLEQAVLILFWDFKASSTNSKLAILTPTSSTNSKPAKDLLNKAKIDVLTVPKLNSKDVFSAMLGVNEPTSKTIGNPDHNSNKGTGVHSRWKSKAEIEKEAA
ncbi:hypothetical protein Tco_1433310 [Tanacetum coccineum]